MSYRNFTKNTSGAATPMFMFFTVIFLVFGGVAIDTSNAYRMRTAMQAAADSAAIAAAKDLPNVDAARATAAAYVQLNMPSQLYGDLTQATDIVIGNWNSATKVLDENGLPINSVGVKLVRAEMRGNPLPTHLLRFAGLESWDIGTKAVAVSIRCVGMISNSYVDLNATNLIGPGFCIYGRDYIKAGSYFTAEVGSQLMTLDKGTGGSPIDFTAGEFLTNNADMSTGDIKPERALRINQTIADWIADAQVGRAAPTGYTFELMSGDSPPNPWQNDRIYLYKNNMSFGSGSAPVSNVIIAVQNNLDFGSGASILNQQDCQVANPVGIFAGGEIKFGSNSNLNGVDIISGRNVDLGQNGANKHVIIEAVNQINTGSTSSFRVCQQLVLPGSEIGGQLALVQ